MKDVIEMGTISSRGQIAVPIKIREKLRLKEGQKVLFFLEDDTLLIKKVTKMTFAEITKPLKEAAKKAGLKEKDVSNVVHRFRKKKR